MKNFFTFLMLFTFVCVSFCCEPGEKIEWSGASCECSSDGVNYNCGIPREDIDFATCGNKIIKWACTTCRCEKFKGKDFFKCGEPTCNTAILGQHGYCVPRSSFPDDCNNCYCHDGRSAGCTLMACLKHTKS